MLESQMEEEEVRIEDVATSLGLSLFHLHRLFLSATGETPARFLRRIRMDTAALRLKWSDEPAVSIAGALGYQDRTAFVRAFKARFGVPPNAYRRSYRDQVSIRQVNVTGRNIMLREIENLRLLTRRFQGEISNLREYWRDFLTAVPPELSRPGNRLFVAMMYDDPRVTRPELVRYDCAVTIGSNEEYPSTFLAERNLQVISIRPGRYASIEHRGPAAAVAETYDTLFHKWLIPNGFVPGNEPALEVHTVPRNLQDRENLAFTLLMPIE